MLKHTTLLLALVIILSSCAKDNPVTPNSTFQPKAGSTFTYDDYNTDTASGLPVTESRDTSVFTFLQSGLTYAGRTNVSKITIADRNSTDTNYVNFEANGDISFLLPDGGTMTTWITYPVSSKTTVALVISDTTVDFFEIVIRTKLTLTTAYVGTETMVVKAQNVSVVKMKQSFVTATTTGGVTETMSSDTFLYFASSLGFVTKTETPSAVSPFGGEKMEGSVSALIDFDLK